MKGTEDMVNNIKKRIFIAINFNDKTKKNLCLLQNKINTYFPENNPIKWTREENLHLTLFFVGYIRDEDLMSAFDDVEGVVKNYEKFSINFNDVDYFPKDKSAKKMIWIFGENNETLQKLQKDIKQKILNLKNEKETIGISGSR